MYVDIVVEDMAIAHNIEFHSKCMNFVLPVDEGNDPIDC